jgi:hypothetical protein
LFLLLAEEICQIGISILCKQEILQNQGYRIATANICSANDSDVDAYYLVRSMCTGRDLLSTTFLSR